MRSPADYRFIGVFYQFFPSKYELFRFSLEFRLRADRIIVIRIFDVADHDIERHPDHDVEQRGEVAVRP